MFDINTFISEKPLWLASGILGSTGSSLIRVIKEGKAGGVVTKSIGLNENKGNPNPTVIELDYGLINSMGLPNPSYINFKDEINFFYSSIQNFKKRPPLIASIYGKNETEFVTIAIELEKTNINGLELNLSCPNVTNYGFDIGNNYKNIKKITKAVKDNVDVPVFVKLTPNVKNIQKLGLAAQDGGADAIVAINTVKGMVIDIYSGTPILGNKFGGLSGPQIKPIAIKCIYDLYSILDIPIIGVGGVSKWEDAIEMFMAGATVIQIGTAVFKKINIFEQLWDEITIYLKKFGYKKYNHIIGLSHKR